jgi:hypothetical protein
MEMSNETTGGSSILDQIVQRRDEERQLRTGWKLCIGEDDAVLEHNRQGTMRWYLYPGDGSASNSLIFYRYEIPPHSHTGKQLVQGNLIAFPLNGYGRVLITDREHAWSAEDLIALPPLTEGHEFQIFNDSDETAKVLVCQPNFHDLFGIDQGSGFEQLEDAPQEGR